MYVPSICFRWPYAITRPTPFSPICAATCGVLARMHASFLPPLYYTTSTEGERRKLRDRRRDASHTHAHTHDTQTARPVYTHTRTQQARKPEDRAC